MPLGDVCVHTATPTSTSEIGPRIEGERDQEPQEATPFDCFLMLPASREQDTPRGRRTIRQPTILYEPEDQLGHAVLLEAENELMILAEELPGHDEPVRYQVDGDPEPLAAPGDLIGFEARLKAIKD
jgi:hypothetical protein